MTDNVTNDNTMSTKLKYDYIVKMVVVGDSGVGKTSMLLRYTDNSFMEHHITTIGVDFKFKDVIVGDTTCKVQLWDTAGQERFRSILATYYRGAHAVILVFDVNDRKTFLNLPGWLSNISGLCQPDIVKYLIGNKTDLDKSLRQVTQDEAIQFAKENDIMYGEASAKDGSNIVDFFEDATKKVLSNLKVKYDNKLPAMNKIKVVSFKGDKIKEDKCCN